MGFDTVLTTLAASMGSNAVALVDAFAPVLALFVGVSLGGYALIVLRRFLS